MELLSLLSCTKFFNSQQSGRISLFMIDLKILRDLRENYTTCHTNQFRTCTYIRIHMHTIFAIKLLVSSTTITKYASSLTLNVYERDWLLYKKKFTYNKIRHPLYPSPYLISIMHMTTIKLIISF